MKKLIIVFIVLSILLMILSGIKLNQAFSSLPTVYYDGDSNEFTYLNAKNKDLFKDLKEIMPGDIKKQDILFKIQNIKKGTKLFLNINNNLDIYNLENVKFKIYVDNKEAKQNGEYIVLGDFSKDTEFKLKVVVEVSTQAGNELQGLDLNMDWEILLQEENNEPIEIPVTYDDTNIILHFSICIISIIVMVYSILKLRKNNKE